MLFLTKESGIVNRIMRHLRSGRCRARDPMDSHPHPRTMVSSLQ